MLTSPVARHRPMIHHPTSSHPAPMPSPTPPQPPKPRRTGLLAATTLTLGLALSLTLSLATGCSKSTDVDSIIASADRHFEKREFEAAKIQYINALRVQQTNNHALMRLGRIFFEQGQLQSAFPLLRQVRDTYPREVPVREALALIYSISGTNLWKEEVDALLEIDPANETAVMTQLRTARSPEEIAAFTNRLASLRTRAGDNRAVFTLAEGELALRSGDRDTAIQTFRRAISQEPSSVLAHLTLGGVLLGNGLTNEALPLLAKAADLSPPYGIARLRYAQALLQTGQTNQAIQVLDELNAKAPEVIPAWTARAEVAFANKEFPEARRFLARAFAQSPADPNSLRVRAKIDLAENKPADAVQALDAAAKWNATSPEFQFQLAIANLLNKDLDRAISHLRESIRLDPRPVEPALLLAELEIARGNSSEAIGTLVDITRRAPQVLQAHMLLARAFRATGRLDDAIQTYAAAAQQFPTNTAPRAQLGTVLVQRQRTKDARDVFEDCLRLDPLHPVAFEQLVQLDVRAGDRAAAAARVEQRLRATPNDPLPWLVKSELARTSGDTAAGEAALRRVLEIDPNSQQALVALAQLYINTGRNAEALAELKRAIEKAPANVGALTLVGMLHSEAGNLQEARSAYEAALKHQPDSWLVLNNLAFLLSEKLGDPSTAYELASRARRVNPRSAVIADTLGWLEYRRANYPEALRLLLDAVESLGSNPEVQFHLGMAHYMMGQEAPARIALQQAVASTTSFDGKETARAHLAILDIPPDDASPQTIATLEKRRTEAPKDLVALSRLAQAYAASGATAKSRETFENALKVNPNSAPLLTGFALLNIQHLGNTNRALELARQARQAAPQDPSIAFDSGRVAYAAGDHPYAYSLLQDAASKQPNDPTVLSLFATAALAVGRIDQATNTMILIAAGTNTTHAAAARSFVERVQFALRPDASRVPPSVEQAIANDPDSLASLFATARLNEARGRVDQALQSYERTVARFPAFTPATRQLALLLPSVAGQESRAYDLTLKLRQELPRDQELATSLGKLALRRGDFRFSVQLLADATRSRPTDADALYHLGLAHAGLKQIPEAKAALEKAIAASPDAPFVPEAKKTLATLESPQP